MKTFKTLCFLSILLFPILAFSQDCDFYPSDTTICGYTMNLPFQAGNFEFECETGSSIAITSNASEYSLTFSSCGDYTLVFGSSIESCTEEITVFVADPGSTSINTGFNINLGYGDIDCPDDQVAECDDTDGVQIELPSGTPVEVWDFCAITTCETNTYITTVFDEDESTCLADSIHIDNFIIGSSAENCSDTSQNAFIVLDPNGDEVLDNSFLEYISSLINLSELDCEPYISNCSYEFDTTCYDTTRMDTLYLPIPVRLGGGWTVNQPVELVLTDTTYFSYQSIDYELIIAPGADFYGPGNLDVFLSELVINSNNDTIREFPSGINLELEWKEDWTYDTISIIKEVAIDTTGDCFTFGGFSNTFNYDIPPIPDFPCGPVSIIYPSECECNYEEPNFAWQMVDCTPPTWNVSVLSGDHFITDIYNANGFGGGNSVNFTNPSSTSIDIAIADVYGCEYYYTIYIEDYIEEVFISSSGNLSCLNSEVYLDVSGRYGINGNVESVDGMWTLPDGSNTFGPSIIATGPGNYIVSFTDNNGCEISSNYEVVFIDESEIVDNHITVCNDELPYQFGNLTISNSMINALGSFSTTYNTGLQNEYGCDSLVNLTLEINSISDDFDYQSFCTPEGLNVDVSSIFENSGSDGVLSAMLLDQNGNIVGEIENEDLFTLPYNLEDGVYELIIEKTKNGSICQKSFQLNLNFSHYLPEEVYLEVPDVICPNDEFVTINASSSDDNMLYQWNTSNLVDYSISGENNEEITFAWSDEIQNLEVYGINECGLETTASTNIEEVDLPTISILVNDACVNVSKIIEASGLQSYSDVIWNAEGADLQQSINDNEKTLMWSDAGDYPLIISGIHESGCDLVYEETITVHDQPTIELIYDDIDCVGEVYTELLVETNKDNVIMSLNQKVFDQTVDITTGAYIIDVVDEFGCSNSDSINIAEKYLEAEVIGDFSVVEDDELDYSINVLDAFNVEIDNISWFVNDEEICFDCDDISTAFDDHSSLVNVIEYNEHCTFKMVYPINVTPKTPKLYIPNIFSPNGDGMNDFWTVTPNDEDVIFESVLIFDRWSNLVYKNVQSGTENTMKWDGKVSGSQVLTGVYIYFIEFTANGNTYQVKGDVTVIY